MMKYFRFKILVSFLLLLSIFNNLYAEDFPKGNLFIIGGGDRALSTMKKLIEVAELRPYDYIVVLPMATEYPDTAFFYVNADLKQICSNKIVMLNFDSSTHNDRIRTDSIRKAKLIFHHRR
jgi:cyanophycinase